MTLQFPIALCAGMVAATLLPPVRRAVPRPVEIVMWLLLVFVCVIAIASITNPNARELTASAFWGIDQVFNTVIGLLLAGALAWLAEHRFIVAGWLVLVCGVDIVALAMLHSHRTAQAWQPRVRLGEWMELPFPVPAVQPVARPYALDGPNRWLAAAMAVAAAAMLTWLVNFMIWARDVLLPREAERLSHSAALGRIQSRARLESLRDTAAQLRFAARSWYTPAGAPVQVLATRAAGISGGAGEIASGRVAEIKVLLAAQSIGWYGPLRPRVAATEEEDQDGSRQKDRLAS